MKCSMKLLSPLHVGNGNELKMIDFYFDIKKGEIKYINLEKFIDFCLEKDIDLNKEISKNEYKTGKDFSITKFMKKKQIDPENLTSYSVPAIIEKRNRESEFAIREFIKCGGAYVPGSSIKGAIRTAMMWYYLNERPDGEKIVLEGLEPWLGKNRISGHLLKNIDDNISAAVFGKDPRSDVFRVLRVSDTSLIEMNRMEVSEIRIVGNPQEIPIYVENIKAGSELSFDIDFNKFLLNDKEALLCFKTMDSLSLMNIKSVFKACNDFSRNVIEKHLEYVWEDYKCDSTVYELESLLKQVKNCNDNEAILRIGWGGGWYSTTVGLILEKLPEFPNHIKGSPKNWELKKGTMREQFNLGRKPGTNRYSFNFPKTRRVTLENKLLGWVKLCFKDDLYNP